MIHLIDVPPGNIHIDFSKKFDEAEVQAVAPPVAPEQDDFVACVQMVGMYFDTNKNFLLPSAVEGIRKMVDVYENYPTSKLLLIGHTDASGYASYNETLSLERAEAVLAYLTDDVQAWLNRYSSALSDSKRWGLGEDLAMLSALPDSSTHESAASPVKSYQESRGLEPDGISGPKTRTQLITDYMALDKTSLPASVEATVHGCGEYFPLEGSNTEGADAKNRRVEMFFFEKGIDPAPPGSISKSGSIAYPAWVDKIQELHRLDEALELGEYYVATDVRVEEFREKSDYNVLLRLSSSSGEMQTVSLRHDYLEHEGFADALFEHLSMRSLYTLEVGPSETELETVFESIPFAKLSKHDDSHHDDLLAPTDKEPNIMKTKSRRYIFDLRRCSGRSAFT